MARIPRSKTLVYVALALIIITHSSLLACGALLHTPNWDEAAHLVAGLAHWQSGTFDLYRVNPPLVRLIAAGPVALRAPNIPSIPVNSAVRYEFEIGHQFIRSNGKASLWYFTIARWFCIPFSLLGAYVSYRWARELYGTLSGLFAVCLWCFSPSMIAHGQMITPDVACSSMALTSTYLFWLWLKRSTQRRAIAAGIALGMAQLTKTTLLILLPLWLSFWLVSRFSAQWRRRGVGRARELPQLAMMALLALLLVNAGYGFEGSFQRLGEFTFVSRALGGAPAPGTPINAPRQRFADSMFAEIPVPFPKNYISGIDLQKFDFERKKWSYLRGEWRLGGWWYYYLYALGIKTPVGTLGLAALALFLSIARHGYSADEVTEAILLGSASTFVLLVSAATGFNHHLRYVLPAAGFAFVWMSKVARSIGERSPRYFAVAASLLLCSVVSSLSIYPHSLSYFNEFVGGPANGHKYLGGSVYDSNIDWGQDLLYLQHWLCGHPDAKPLRIAFNGPCDPQLIGVEPVVAPPDGPNYVDSSRERPAQTIGPLPGWFAVSVNAIRSRTKEYDYFLRFKPVATAGFSIYIYHISTEEADLVRKDLGLPPCQP